MQLVWTCLSWGYQGGLRLQKADHFDDCILACNRFFTMSPNTCAKPSEIIQHLSNIHQTTCNGSSCPSSTQDEIHTIVGAGGTGDGGGAIDAGNIMKPALSRGELQAMPGAGWIHMSNDLQNDVISFYFNSFHNFHIGSAWFNIEIVNMVWLGMTLRHNILRQNC